MQTKAQMACARKWKQTSQNRIIQNYEFSFLYGGKITFTAFASKQTKIKFKFEEKLNQEYGPEYYTNGITITQTSQDFSRDIPSKHRLGPFSSLFLYLTERDVFVTLTNIKIFMATSEKAVVDDNRWLVK